MPVTVSELLGLGSSAEVISVVPNVQVTSSGILMSFLSLDRGVSHFWGEIYFVVCNSHIINVST